MASSSRVAYNGADFANLDHAPERQPNRSPGQNAIDRATAAMQDLLAEIRKGKLSGKFSIVISAEQGIVRQVRKETSEVVID